MSKETIEQKLKNYQVLTNWQKDKIALLEAKIKDFESIKAAECCECERGAVQDYIDLSLKIECFNDDYFKNLSYEEIAQLAKKSIRITTDNCNLQDKIERIGQIIQESENRSSACLAIWNLIKDELRGV